MQRSFPDVLTRRAGAPSGAGVDRTRGRAGSAVPDRLSRRVRDVLLAGLLAGALLPGGMPGVARAEPAAFERLISCVNDQLPHQAAGACSGLLTDECMETVTTDHARHALACWAEEERLWLGWAGQNAREAAELMAPQHAGAAGDIARVQQLWEAWSEAACALHPLAWPGDSNGPLLEAQCRVRHAAQQAVDLYWLSRP